MPSAASVSDVIGQAETGLRSHLEAKGSGAVERDQSKRLMLGSAVARASNYNRQSKSEYDSDFDSDSESDS